MVRIVFNGHLVRIAPLPGRNRVHQSDEYHQKVAGQMEPPICAPCHTEMSWSWSKLVVGKPDNFILHQFVYSSYGRAAETRSKVKRNLVLQNTKLSAPRFRLSLELLLFEEPPCRAVVAASAGCGN